MTFQAGKAFVYLCLHGSYLIIKCLIKHFVKISVFKVQTVLRYLIYFTEETFFGHIFCAYCLRYFGSIRTDTIQVENMNFLYALKRFAV